METTTAGSVPSRKIVNVEAVGSGRALFGSGALVHVREMEAAVRLKKHIVVDDEAADKGYQKPCGGAEAARGSF